MVEWIRPIDRLPHKKDGWNHSERVLVWYADNESDSECYGIAYYNYEPPFSKPGFVDFAHYGRQPSLWTPIEPPNV